MNINEVEWLFQDGAIFTKDTEFIKTAAGNIRMSHYIAFNVQSEVAERIVRLHNESLEQKALSALWDRFIDHLNATVPLGKDKEKLLHQSFIGSIEKYKRVFVSMSKD